MLSGQTSCLARMVGLAEDPESNAESIKPIGGREEIALRADGTQDEMRMSLVGRQEGSGGLNRGLDGLNGDLRGGQIAPHENVQVRNLGEGGGHGWYS